MEISEEIIIEIATNIVEDIKNYIDENKADFKGYVEKLKKEVNEDE